MASGLTFGVGGSLDVDTGGTALDMVLSGGTGNIFGDTISTTIEAGGQAYLYFSGFAASSVIDTGGSMFIGFEGGASGTLVQGGTETVGPGGIDSGSTLISGGFELISAGGSGFDIVISSGGTEFVSSGATVSGVTVLSGGLLEVQSGMTVPGLINDGGTVIVPCFAAGTLILTEDGSIAVEALAVGQRVPTHGGEMLSIAWIGHRSLDCERHRDPSRILPVIIEAHAFGPNLPNRDLFLSPDHAVFAEGVLIPIRHLINGDTIRQVPMTLVTYFHIELACHSVIWAEGLPVETYLDTGDRQAFAQGGNTVALYPAWGSERTDITMIMEAHGYAPLRVTGPEVELVKARTARGGATRAPRPRKPSRTRKPTAQATNRNT
jgi:autotransporter passenger strand-loop-strand repeat protein